MYLTTTNKQGPCVGQDMKQKVPSGNYSKQRSGPEALYSVMQANWWRERQA